MELVWIPQMEIACKETLQLIDNRNFRKDVMVILKSRSLQPARVRSSSCIVPKFEFIPYNTFFLFLPEDDTQIPDSR